MIFTTLVLLNSPLLDAQGSDSVKARAVECVQSSWNAYDARAASALLHAGGGSRPQRGPRADRLARQRRVPFVRRRGALRFRFSIVAMDSNSVEATFVEHNDFLAALGIDSVQARWRYVVNGGVINEEQHL